MTNKLPQDINLLLDWLAPAREARRQGRSKGYSVVKIIALVDASGDHVQYIVDSKKLAPLSRAEQLFAFLRACADEDTK